MRISDHSMDKCLIHPAWAPNCLLSSAVRSVRDWRITTCKEPYKMDQDLFDRRMPPG